MMKVGYEDTNKAYIFSSKLGIMHIEPTMLRVCCTDMTQQEFTRILINKEHYILSL